MKLHNKSTKADYEYLEGKDGFFVGMLDEYELESFNRLCEDGLAERYYPDGMYIILGLPKVRLRKDFSYDEVL